MSIRISTSRLRISTLCNVLEYGGTWVLRLMSTAEVELNILFQARFRLKIQNAYFMSSTSWVWRYLSTAEADLSLPNTLLQARFRSMRTRISTSRSRTRTLCIRRTPGRRSPARPSTSSTTCSRQYHYFVSPQLFNFLFSINFVFFKNLIRIVYMVDVRR